MRKPAATVPRTLERHPVREGQQFFVAIERLEHRSPSKQQPRQQRDIKSARPVDEWHSQSQRRSRPVGHKPERTQLELDLEPGWHGSEQLEWHFREQSTGAGNNSSRE
jgi:hypothetical protein